MTQEKKLPDPEMVKHTSAKMQEICKRWDALIMVTDYMIAELEEHIRRQPNEVYRLKRAKRLLSLEQEKLEAVETPQD